MSKFALATLALACAAAVPMSAQAFDVDAGGPFMMRVRAVHIDPANQDTTGLGLGVSSKTIPEVDFSYFVTPNIAAELILTYPQSHDIDSNGSKIGSLKELPPTLTVQYHFAPTATIRPYVGIGGNYTNFSSVSFNPAVVTALHPSIAGGSWGWAVQAGADVALGNNLYLNVDVKKVSMSTGVYSSGASVGKLSVDPVLVGVGIGFHF